MHGDLAKESELYRARPRDADMGTTLATVPEPPKVRDT